MANSTLKSKKNLVIQLKCVSFRFVSNGWWSLIYHRIYHFFWYTTGVKMRNVQIIIVLIQTHSGVCEKLVRGLTTGLKLPIWFSIKVDDVMMSLTRSNSGIVCLKAPKSKGKCRSPETQLTFYKTLLLLLTI